MVRAGTSTNTFTYQDAGPVTSETQSGVVVTNRLDALLRRTNVAVVVNGTVVSSTGYGYDSAGRLATVTDGTNSATYSYVANSRLIDQIVFKQGATTRMTTGRTFDYLSRLIWIGSTPSADGVVSFTYGYNSANQRVGVTNADSSRWAYNYDKLGQVTNGNKFWSDGTAVLGQQFGYLFDDIGNRKTVVSGGDANGSNKRTQTYGANVLNQYTQRAVPGYLDIIGSATNPATVTVNNTATSRKADYYRAEVSVLNSGAAVWQPITNVAVLASGTNDYVTNWTGNVFVPPTPERFTFDLDGNQTSDGRWTNRWDGENRLLSMTSHANAPVASRLSLSFAYDSQSRRISKVVSNWTGSAWVKLSEQRFIYDGWNLLAISDANNTVLYSFHWGTDLSGSMQGAGGVGGLISMTVHSGVWAGTYFYAFDGNGNVAALISAADGSMVARYEYDTFGRMLLATGPLAFTNPFRFSTKFQDDETGLLYYGYRYYDPSAGRWLNRDPIGESGGANLYGFVKNAPTDWVDVLGKWKANVHYGRTLSWAADAGIRLNFGVVIADADIGVDSIFGGESFLPEVLGGRQSRHLLYFIQGEDSRDYWYRTEFEKARNHLKFVRCREAAKSFGMGLHSRQDKSAHRPWPTGSGSWQDAGAQLTAHPGWWDAWTRDDLNEGYPSDEFWRRYNQPPDYAAWMDTEEQNASQEEKKQQVVLDSQQAIGRFVEEVRNSCCKKEILINP